MLFLCRVALGSSSVGAANLRRPPDGFDSTTNGGGSGAAPTPLPGAVLCCRHHAALPRPCQLPPRSQAGCGWVAEAVVSPAIAMQTLSAQH